MSPRRLIVVLLSFAVAAMAVPAVVGVPAAQAALKPGSTGKTVKTLQRKLRVRPVDGEWGPATTRALKRFQRRNGLTATGRLDTQTKQKLGYGVSSGSGLKSTYSADVIEH